MSIILKVDPDKIIARKLKLAAKKYPAKLMRKVGGNPSEQDDYWKIKKRIGKRMNNIEAEQRREALRSIKNEVLHLASSPLYAERVKNKVCPVIGEGSHFAGIMFVGEAPGKNEAAIGRPFVGAAGRILDELFACAKISRDEVYITNIVKDRPPKNRDPLPIEIELYAPFLDKQIEIIKPKVIVTLGRFSMIYIMTKYGLEHKLKPISKIHGRKFEIKTSYGTVILIPLHHPAASIYNSSTKSILKNDFKKLVKYLAYENEN